MIKVSDKFDTKTKKFYEKSIMALGKLECRPSEKAWNKLAQREFYMSSISMKVWAEQESWMLLYFIARREYKRAEKLKINSLASD